MAISTQFGETSWAVKEVSAACGGVSGPTALRRLRNFEQAAAATLAALRQVSPATRPCDLASMLAAMLETGGALAGLDRPRLEARLRQIAQQIDGQRTGRGD
jgi:hypothetical protein